MTGLPVLHLSIDEWAASFWAEGAAPDRRPSFHPLTERGGALRKLLDGGPKPVRASGFAMTLPASADGIVEMSPLATTQLTSDLEDFLRSRAQPHRVRAEGQRSALQLRIPGLHYLIGDAVLLAPKLSSGETFLLADDVTWWASVGRLALAVLRDGAFAPVMAERSGAMYGKEVEWWPRWDLPQLGEAVGRLVARAPISAFDLSSVEDATVGDLLDITRAALNSAADVGVSRHLHRFERPGNRGGRLRPTAPPLPFHVRQDLGGSEERLSADPTALSWIAGIGAEAASSVATLRFDLVPPAERVPIRVSQAWIPDPDTPWTLRATLVSRADLTLELSAERLGSPTAAVWAREVGGDPVREMAALIADFADVYPPARQGPSGIIDISAADIEAFLLEDLPRVMAAGWEVRLPSGWAGAPAKLRASVIARGVKSTGLFGLAQLAEFDWRVAVGESSTLTSAQLERLARLKIPVVLAGGRWVRVDVANVSRMLKLLQRSSTSTVTDALKLHAGLLDPELDDEVAVTFDGPLQAFLSADVKQIPAVSSPSGLAEPLLPWQEEGLSWMWFLDQLGLGACLADDMGLGKTVQALSLILLERELLPSPPAPTLVVAPAGVIPEWKADRARFTPSLRMHVHHDRDRLTAEEMQQISGQVDFVLTSYGVVRNDTAPLAAINWHRLILDEANEIKNFDTKQSRAVRKLRAARCVALSGTPLENRLAELWSLMAVITPGLLGSWNSFQRDYIRPVERENDIERGRRLHKLVRPFVLQRLKTDPEVAKHIGVLKHEREVPCILTAEQAELYDSVLKAHLTELAEDEHEGVSRYGIVFKLLTKLKQLCNHPALMLDDFSAPLAGRSGKLMVLEQTLEHILERGEKTLCFTQFAEWGEMLAPHLESRFGAPVGYYHGGLNPKARDALKREFARNSSMALMIVTTRAGGRGLNLQAANHVIHYDRWWNAAREDQASDRAYRVGQTKDVWVRKLVCQGTLEEHISKLIATKRGLARLVIRNESEGFAALSNEELEEWLALSDEARAETWQETPSKP